jgi:hypothetical protein
MPRGMSAWTTSGIRWRSDLGSLVGPRAVAAQTFRSIVRRAKQLRGRCRTVAVFAGTILAVSIAGKTMPKTRVLVVYRATGDLGDAPARQLALTLRQEGVEAEACESDAVPDLEDYDGIAVEGAREGTGWTLFARDFARRHASELKVLPAWFLPARRGSGYLDVREQIWWGQSIARSLGGEPASVAATAAPSLRCGGSSGGPRRCRWGRWDARRRSRRRPAASCRCPS